MSGAAGSVTPTDVLVVCEADRARSPVLAALLRRELERRGLDDRVTVTDAGVRAQPGEPLLPSVDRAVRGLDLDLAQHRSTALDPGVVADHGVVLTMTEAQRRTVVRWRPEALSRTFTVREALRLLGSRRWDARWEGTPDVVAHLHQVRPLVAAPTAAEDVPDPADGGRRLAGTVVAELQRSSTRLARALWGAVPAQASTVGR